MKAIVYTEYGSPDVLHLKEVEKPVPKEKEVLVKVHATTVNRTDCGFLRAKPWIVRLFSGLTKPKNTILGNEFAGEVEAIGKNVTSLKIGDKVFGYSGEVFGAHAEYIALHEDGPVSLMPSNFTYEEAAPGTESIHYAWTDIRAAKVQKGQHVLVYGASGAIGSAGLQFVRYLGAHVTAVTNTKNVQLAKSLGADTVIDYLTEDFTKHDQRYDFIFDAVGKSSYRVCKPLLQPNGIYCSTDFGPFPWNPLLALWTWLFGSRKVIFPLPKNNKQDVIFFKELMEAGKLKPVIDRIYPLEEVADAFRYVETGQKTGNVVIKIT